MYDISVLITPKTPVWPGDAHPSITRVQKLEAGDIANVSHLDMSAHTATHVDAPRHFIAEGKGVEHLPLEVLIGEVQVIEFYGNRHVTADDLKNVHAERLLIKTSNSALWGDPHFHEEYIALSADGAQGVVDKGIKLVGIDYLSIAPFDNVVPTHEILLKKGVVILEGVDLSAVPPGVYTLHCLPIKVAGADGAPARVILA